MAKKTLFNISEKLGLHSLRGRYIFIVTCISILLLFSAFIGWKNVNDISQSQLWQIQYRSEAADALEDVSTQINTLETNLQRFITLTDNENRRAIQRAFELYDASLIKLRNNAWVINDPSLIDITFALENDRIRLEEEIEQLIHVRVNETDWFPAMQIMQERMLIHNQQFMSAVELAENETNYDLNSKIDIEIFRLMHDIKYSWMQLISEFRLFVSNSFGVFSNDPESGMESRKFNIELYSERIDNIFTRLDNYERKGKLGLLTVQSLSDMKQAKAAWQTAYSDVVNSFEDRSWRRDLQILKERVDPLFGRLRQRSSSLQLELGVASAKDITRLTNVAKQFSDYVIYLVFVIVAGGILGFGIFHKVLLQPLSQISSALKAEAQGQAVHGIIASSALEIKQLTNAFNSMREQIRSRQAHLDHMAHHDALTSLPNRVLFQDRLKQAMSRAQRDKTLVGLMFLDLDRFKQINDTLGHMIGDRLLKVVASRLVSCVRATDTVSRLGGDEFAIVIEGVTHPDQLASMAKKILKAFDKPFRVEHHELHSTTSIGIAVGPTDDRSVEALIKDADIAMYHAKDLGRNNYKFYSADMAASVAKHLAIENQLRQALENDEFVLHYQPIVDLQSGQIISAESLLRWQHPEKGLLPPAEFLSVLEDSGLIYPVTQWALEKINQQYTLIRDTGHSNFRISINLSGMLLRGEAIMDVIINAIQSARMDPKSLIMEITEDTLVDDIKQSHMALNTLQEMGIRIALDDFGTGQSSLNHLRKNPIDIVKIDRDFIRDIPSDRNDSELVDAVIAMAHKLHIKVIAEGVETKQQLEFLRWHKCDAIQGYYFSPPVASDELLQLLTVEKRMLG